MIALGISGLDYETGKAGSICLDCKVKECFIIYLVHRGESTLDISLPDDGSRAGEWVGGLGARYDRSYLLAVVYAYHALVGTNTRPSQ